MKNKIALSLLSVALLSAGMTAHAAKPRGPGGATPVVSETVQTHEVSQSLTLIGKLEADQSVIVASEVSGKVETILVKANQFVNQGELLIKLDDDKAIAAVAEAKAYLKDEQRKLKEFERLAKKNAITQTEIEGQRANVDIANARLDAANANLKDLHISAPFAGTVGFIDFSRGALVSSGSELITLDDLSVMQLDLQVPERYLAQISNGMEVIATTSAWGDQTFTGTVVGIDSRINSESLNLRVRIHFDNPEQRLKPGMLVSADMAFPPISAPIIPVQALEYSGTKRYVYVIGEDNKVTRTEVFLGARIGNEVVIEKGLDIGANIVVQGIVNMRDGASVKILSTDGVAVELPSGKPSKSAAKGE
ncbi:efflux RND transporter periplasmic adaptor subunit [Vibrio maerlii]|uniref:efflux RND transporter periplasmic adaptor subunit n=1 Tax=Vibrio maerlii TaxID=2231648 RepID=UPI000E3DD253|nr:efflux RND transporter periplasmic adaptor subunit [Vibrio maerlii]